MPELTDAEMAELAERLRAGDPKAIGPALRALPKPQRKVLPEVHQPNGLTIEAESLKQLRADLTKLSNLHSKFMDSRRAISAAMDEARRQGKRFPTGQDLMRHEVFIQNNDATLHGLLETFLHTLRLRIGKPSDSQ